MVTLRSWNCHCYSFVKAGFPASLTSVSSRFPRRQILPFRAILFARPRLFHVARGLEHTHGLVTSCTAALGQAPRYSSSQYDDDSPKLKSDRQPRAAIVRRGRTQTPKAVWLSRKLCGRQESKHAHVQTLSTRRVCELRAFLSTNLEGNYWWEDGGLPRGRYTVRGQAAENCISRFQLADGQRQEQGARLNRCPELD